MPTQPARSIGRGRPLDLRRLWEVLADPANAAEGRAVTTRVSLDELVRIWWGDRQPASAGQLASLTEVLAVDDRYFAVDRVRPDSYRVRTRDQVQLSNRRRQQMSAYGDLEDCWLLVRDPQGEPRLSRPASVAADHVTVTVDGEIAPAGVADSAAFPVWPEDILAVFDHAEEAESALARLAGRLDVGNEVADMEPNQALRVAKAHFPPEARLRRAGYRLAEKILALSFDFPDVVLETYASEIEALATQTGWQIEIAPEANQAALNALAAECLPAGWIVRKGPSIRSVERQVSVTVSPDMNAAFDPEPKLLYDSEDRFVVVSGYALKIEDVDPVGTPLPKRPTVAGEPMEINAAYAAIRQALAGSSLYRTSLKGGEIVLTFISPQAGERHREGIEKLEEEVGWSLSIHPQPNQNAILDTARRLLQDQGWSAIKGPSIYVDRGRVSVTLAERPAADALVEVQDTFEEKTGYKLAIALEDDESIARPDAAPVRSDTAAEIAIERIRLQAMHRSLALNPAKLNNALTRIRRDGVASPPILVRRLRDEYLLLDGLYRLRAAQTLGHTHILAEIEG